jgi:hypothetical protein
MSGAYDGRRLEHRYIGVHREGILYICSLFIE